jgi:hypothetical protein
MVRLRLVVAFKPEALVQALSTEVDLEDLEPDRDLGHSCFILQLPDEQSPDAQPVVERRDHDVGQLQVVIVSRNIQHSDGHSVALHSLPLPKGEVLTKERSLPGFVPAPGLFHMLAHCRPMNGAKEFDVGL